MGGLDLGVAAKVLPYLSYMFNMMEKVINQIFKMFGINLDDIEVETGE